MKVSTNVLRHFLDVPSDPRALRELLDDVGLEVKRVEPMDDGGTRFVLELLANRGDHHCYEGIARELNGRLGRELRTPTVTSLEVGESPHPLRTETPLCLRYTLTLLERTGPADATLSAGALAVLDGAAIHSLTAPVDATNVANLELGQPTHAFDADTIVGAVTVRTSVAGERCLPLFQEESVELPVGTLVIADDAKILAVAGVIGCEESKTTDATTRLLLESACFDPVAVRKASRALSIHTDSSARFERGSDPERVLVGAGRVADLLAEAGWARRGTTGMVGDHVDPGRVIPLSVAATGRFLDVAVDAAEVSERLGRYGFEVRAHDQDSDVLLVGVPSWRLWDVAFAADLYEELAKSIGYNATPVSLPPVALGAAPSAEARRKEQVEEVLLGQGFYEVFTDGFYGRDVLELLDLDEAHPLFAHVQTQNALDRGYSFLKNNALAQAVQAVAVNERRRTDDIKLYEWTRTFHPLDEPMGERRERDRPPCTERPLLWAIVMGTDQHRTWAHSERAADALYLKGVVAELAVELGLGLSIGQADPSHPLAHALHPGRQALVLLGGEVVGILGEVHPAVLKRARIKRARPTYLEIDRSALYAAGSKPTFVEPSSTQHVTRTLAFRLPRGVEAGAVASVLHASGSDDLVRVHVTDLYDHGDQTRSVTFELLWSDATTSADATNHQLQELVAEVLGQYGSAGVEQR